MAWTQDDIDALDEVIASGTLTVRTPEGKLVTYQDLDQLRALRSAMLAEVEDLYRNGSTGYTQWAWPLWMVFGIETWYREVFP